LTTLRISGCENLKDVSSIASLHSLEHLSLVGCDAMEHVPLTGLTRLEYLDLNGNDGLTTVDVSGLQKLTLLDLNGSDKLEAVVGLADLIALKDLNVEECERLAIAVAAIKKLDRLEQLNVNRCHKVTSDVIKELPAGITRLRIREVPINDAAVEAIVRRKGLQEVFMEESLPAGQFVKLKSALPSTRFVLFGDPEYPLGDSTEVGGEAGVNKFTPTSLRVNAR
jgi:hypothetical protein